MRIICVVHMYMERGPGTKFVRGPAVALHTVNG